MDEVTVGIVSGRGATFPRGPPAHSAPGMFSPSICPCESVPATILSQTKCFKICFSKVMSPTKLST